MRPDTGLKAVSSRVLNKLRTVASLKPVKAATSATVAYLFGVPIFLAIFLTLFVIAAQREPEYKANGQILSVRPLRIPL
jgi:hypothetical protein